MFWKIYFWILLVLLLLGYMGMAFGKALSMIYFFDLIISIPSLAGFFLFAYKKIFLTAKFWQPYFIIYVLWDCFFNLILGPRIDNDFSWVTAFIGFVIIFPMWIALYLYAFRFLKGAQPQNKQSV